MIIIIVKIILSFFAKNVVVFFFYFSDKNKWFARKCGINEITLSTREIKNRHIEVSGRNIAKGKKRKKYQSLYYEYFITVTHVSI